MVGSDRYRRRRKGGLGTVQTLPNSMVSWPHEKKKKNTTKKKSANSTCSCPLTPKEVPENLNHLELYVVHFNHNLENNILALLFNNF